MENQSDLRDLYQQMIIDHSKKPHNFKVLPNANHTVEGFNPLCGDKIKFYMASGDGLIKEVAFEGSGCAISVASASMMTDAVKGKTTEQAQNLFSDMQKVLTGTAGLEFNYSSLPGNLSVFSGIYEFPARVKCATLPWYALKAAIDSDKKTVSTEEENAS